MGRGGVGGGIGSTIVYPAKPVGEDIIVVAADDISVKAALWWGWLNKSVWKRHVIARGKSKGWQEVPICLCLPSAQGLAESRRLSRMGVREGSSERGRGGEGDADPRTSDFFSSFMMPRGCLRGSWKAAPPGASICLYRQRKS